MQITGEVFVYLYTYGKFSDDTWEAYVLYSCSCAHGGAEIGGSVSDNLHPVLCWGQIKFRLGHSPVGTASLSGLSSSGLGISQDGFKRQEEGFQGSRKQLSGPRA